MIASNQPACSRFPLLLKWTYLIQQPLWTKATDTTGGFETTTSSSAVKCSSTEPYPLQTGVKVKQTQIIGYFLPWLGFDITVETFIFILPWLDCPIHFDSHLILCASVSMCNKVVKYIYIYIFSCSTDCSIRPKFKQL